MKRSLNNMLRLVRTNGHILDDCPVRIIKETRYEMLVIEILEDRMPWKKGDRNLVNKHEVIDVPSANQL